MGKVCCLTMRGLRDVTASFFLVTFLLLCSVPKGEGQLGPPPTLSLARDWRIPEDEPVGARVQKAEAKDHERRELSFTLQPSEHDDLSSYFRIDSRSGIIYLNKSLKGKRGTRGYLYVVVRGVSDDSPSIPARVEVGIQIDPPASSGSGNNNGVDRVPSIPNQPPFLPFQPPNIYPPSFPGSRPPALPSIPVNELPSSSSNNNTPLNPGLATNTANASSTISGEPNNNSIVNLNGTIISLKPLGPSVPINSNDDNGSRTTTISTNRNNTESTEGGMVYEIGQDKGNKGIINVPSTSVETSNSIESGAAAGKGNTSSNTSDDVSDSAGNKVEKPIDNTNTITLITIVPIVVLFGLLPMALAILWLLKKRNKVKKRPTKEIRKESAATMASNVTMSAEGESPSALTQWVGKRAQSNRYESWDPDALPPQVQNHWEFPRHHLQIGGILGEGCFGQVWRSEALNIDGKEGTTTVAVKTLKESAGERERADLLSELAVMKTLDPHPNVVRLLGSCTEKDPIFLIMEYVSLGKLQTYLRNSRAQHYYGNLHGDSSSLSSKDLTSFAHQVARGMEYLASKGIIHRDLAARNILIDKDRVCKVADFGFARDVVANHVYERKSDGRLPIRWMAPEALYDNIFTTKTDVWSFGVLMWEIVTLGSTPYPGMAAGEVMRKVRDGYRLEKPEHCRRELYNIMFYCWAHNPNDRPTFAELVNFLRHLLFSETDYIELDRFPDHDYYNMISLSGEKL